MMKRTNVVRYSTGTYSIFILFGLLIFIQFDVFAQTTAKFDRALSTCEEKLIAYEAKVNTETRRSVLEDLEKDVQSAYAILQNELAPLKIDGVPIPKEKEALYNSIPRRLRNAQDIQMARINKGEVKYNISNEDSTAQDMLNSPLFKGLKTSP